ncbi:MAG: ribosomal-protein-serine acetyltransferase [Actinomycetota bacterium]|nr:ribosomal-protein-serine acetyltransferase [Actinomycetota bacterium]
MKPFPPSASLARLIVTRRLSLEPTGFQHLNGLWSATEESLAELEPWMKWAAIATFEQTSNFVQRAEKMWESTHADEWTFTIVLRGAPIGTVGLAGARQDFRRAELGYWLRSDLAGQGYMTEAASAAIAFAFDDLDLHRLELHAAEGNDASMRVAEKLGFQREGLARHAGFGGGSWQDMHIYGLLSTDPRPTFHL